jgi:hypothetical protein
MAPRRSNPPDVMWDTDRHRLGDTKKRATHRLFKGDNKPVHRFSYLRTVVWWTDGDEGLVITPLPYRRHGDVTSKADMARSPSTGQMAKSVPPFSASLILNDQSRSVSSRRAVTRTCAKH